MKKALLILGGGLLLLLVAVYVAATFFLGSLVKAGVNNFGPRLTQSPVELASARISPLTGSGQLSGLTVGNPAGWSGGRAFYLGEVRLSLEPTSVFKDVIVINELTIDQPEINYETRIVSSNLQDLLKNIEAYTGGQEKAEGTSSSSGAGKKFIVKKFRLTNGKVSVGTGTNVVPVPLPTIALDDLGVQEGGLTSGQLSTAIVRSLVRGIATGVTSSSAYDKTIEAARQLGDSVKSLFKKKP